MPGRFKFVSEIEEADRKAGRCFFEKDTMQFFRSKIASYEVWDGRYFITSEQNWGLTTRGPRLFTIREAVEDTDGFRINTVGEFQAYGTLARAKAGIRQLLREQDIPVNCATAR